MRWRPGSGRLRQEIGCPTIAWSSPRPSTRTSSSGAISKPGPPGLTARGHLGSTFRLQPGRRRHRQGKHGVAHRPDRLADRKGLLGGLDGIKRNLDADGSLEGADYFCQQAFGVVTKGISSAFDVTRKTPRPSPSTTPARSSTPASSSVEATCAASPTCSARKCSWPAGCAGQAVPSSPFRIADGITTPTTTGQGHGRARPDGPSGRPRGGRLRSGFA